MFHKEGTATGSASSSSGGGGGGDGKQQQNRGGGPRGGPKKAKGGGSGASGGGGKGGGVLDVPMRKSDRRKLKSRFVELYLPHLLSKDTGSAEANELNNDNDDGAESKDTSCDQPKQEQEQEQQQTTAMLDFIFTDPNVELSSRKLRPADTTNVLGGKSSEARVTAYIRSASNNMNTSNEEDNDDGPSWQYVIPVPIAFEVEHSESRTTSLVPSVATLSVLPDVLPTIIVNSYTSKHLCRGANLMRGGMGMENLVTVVQDMMERDDVRRSVSVGGNNGGKKSKKGSNQNKRGQKKSGVAVEDAVVAVRVSSNPQPFAVGLIHPELLSAFVGSSDSVNDSEDLVGEGCRGVGINIVNCYGDDWTREMNREVSELGQDIATVAYSPFGGSYNDGRYGNVGFAVSGKDRHVLGLTRCGGEEEGDDEEDGHEDGESSSNAEEKDGDANEEVAEGVASLEVKDGEEEIAAEGVPRKTNAEGGDDAQADDKDDDDKEEDDEEDPAEAQSNLLSQCFQRAVLNLSASSLPMPVSTFYAIHVLKSRPEGTTLDIKTTRWKKFGPFLSEQAALGVVTVKDNQTLTGVNKGHITLKEARKQRKKEREAIDGDTLSSGKTKTAVVTLNIIPSRIASVLALPSDLVSAAEAKAEERRGTGYLTKPEVRACLEWYINEQGLDDGAGDEIQLDGNLCDILYSRSKKERLAAADSSRSDFPTRCTRKDAYEIFLTKLDEGYALVEMPGSRITNLARGKPPTVHIEVSTVRGRKKYVTFVRHLEDYGINPTAFANDVSKRFATSATIEEDPTLNSRAALNKKGYVEISFQGHLAEELRMLLTGGAEGRSGHGGAKGGTYKVPKGCIDVKIKKGVPTRRRG